jgi:ABC-type multidrug transport system fused ATPase/permease subunit
LVGERGAKISGGQMQRIGLARALYRNPEVLILDEATSALDANTEEKIMKSLISRENLTIILITHHMKNVKNYENIFLIENGTISDSGSYKDLIENNSNFKQLISEEIKT